MRVIGTAGHVDHGKSTLVQALTGVHPDRLKEEREREMTIDLGFAWMTLPKSEALPQGEEVGVVDVPGHRDFIENMLAGVGGIDAALFVVAADEGVMPQTREHLAILDVLQISSGVVALTKIDLAPDSDWLELVAEDVRAALAGTALANAPIVPVSARTRQGLPELLQALALCLGQRPLRLDLGRPRLPVDRVFTMPGFGTIVTGTLLDGTLRSGDEVEILGAERTGLRGRVRGLQTHRRKEDEAVPGSRTAVNISGVDVAEIQRGCVVAHPGDYHASRRIDVRFRLLPDVSQPLEHHTEVKFFIGANELTARLRLLGVETLSPGQETWLQLEFEKPVFAVRGDRYILRRPSPGETLGGGIVVEPQPKGRHKRFSAEVLERLQALTRGSPADVLRQALEALGAAAAQDVLLKANLDDDSGREAVQELFEQGQLLVLEGALTQPLSRTVLIAGRTYWQALSRRAVAEVEAYHAAFPLRKGMPKEELKSRLKAAPRLFNLLLRQLTSEGVLLENGAMLARAGHTIVLTPAQQRQVDALLARFAAAPYAPPTSKECLAELNEELYNALLALDLLVFVPPDVVFRRQDYDEMVAEIRRLLSQQGTLTAAEVRDRFNTSRRYALALLEHLDAIGLTVREGDARRLRRPA